MEALLDLDTFARILTEKDLTAISIRRVRMPES